MYELHANAEAWMLLLKQCTVLTSVRLIEETTETYSRVSLIKFCSSKCIGVSLPDSSLSSFSDSSLAAAGASAVVSVVVPAAGAADRPTSRSGRRSAGTEG